MAELFQPLYCTLYRTCNRSNADTLAGSDIGKFPPFRKALPKPLELHVGEKVSHALDEFCSLIVLYGLQLYGEPIGVLYLDAPRGYNLRSTVVVCPVASLSLMVVRVGP